MGRLSIELFGHFQARLDDKEVTGFESEKVRALLAYLVLENERSHRREKLAGLFWPELPEVNARRNLRRALYNLRVSIQDQREGPFLSVSSQTIQFDPLCNFWLDTNLFTHLLNEVQEHRHRNLALCDPCLEKLEEAIALYQGHFMEDFIQSDSQALEEWVLLEREHFRRQAQSALESLVETYHRRNELDPLLSSAERLVALDPWNEVGQRGVIRALALKGQRNAALAQYESSRSVLLEGLGVEPEPATTELYKRIQVGDALAEETILPPHKLPLIQTAYVERKEEQNRVKECLGALDCRLCTLVGPGGSGKTLLVLKVAEDLKGCFEDGIFFVSFEALDSPESMVSSIASVLRFSFSRGVATRQQLLNYLKKKSMLLVLDNYEHLLDEVDLVVDILNTAPNVMILVTSRVRLKLQAEHVITISGMRYPGWDIRAIPDEVSIERLNYSALQLFVHSVRRIQAGFTLDHSNIQDVVRICQLVDGLPLGIVLAASWFEMLNPGEIVHEIERGLDFLETDMHDVPDRHRSMVAVFDHSWSLLSEEERKIFSSLTIFRGGFTQEAAQVVVGTSMRNLQALMDRSLLLREVEGRFTIHQLLRQYASERLREMTSIHKAVKEKHSEYFCDKLMRWERGLKSARQAQTLDEMDAEIENCRAAWEWAVALERMDLLEKARESFYLFFRWRWRLVEGESILRKTAEKLSQARESDVFPVLAGILYRQGDILVGKADWAGMAAVIAQHEELIQDGQFTAQEIRQANANLYSNKSLWLLMGKGDWPKARNTGKKALYLLQDLGDPWRIAYWLNWMGIFYYLAGNASQASEYLEESLELYRPLGDPRGISWSLLTYGDVLMDLGKEEEGEAALRKSITMLRQVGDKSILPLALKDLGSILAEQQGRFTEGHEMLSESASLYAENDDQRMLSWSLGVLGSIKLALGEYPDARCKVQASLALAQKIQSLIMLGFSNQVLGVVALLENKLEEAKGCFLEALLYRGSLGRDQIPLLNSLGVLFSLKRDYPQARIYFCDALHNALDTFGSVPVCIQSVIPGLALYLTKLDQIERAVALYAMAREHFPYVDKARYIDDLIGQRIRAAAASLPPEVIAVAEERGRDLDPWETAREMLAEFEAQVKEG